MADTIKVIMVGTNIASTITAHTTTAGMNTAITVTASNGRT